MEIVICNPQKGRLETIKASINETNTTWFDDCQELNDIYMITDIDSGLLIRENNFCYPVLAYDATRADIDYDPRKAKKLKVKAMSK